MTAEPAGTFLARRAALWESPGLQDTDAVLLAAPVHLRYFTGFSGSSGHLLLTREHDHLITDGRYASQSRDEAEAVEIHIVAGAGLGDVRRMFTPGMLVGWEARRITHARAEELRKEIAGVSWQPVDDAVEALRVIKDAGEIAAIERAVELGDTVFDEIAGRHVPGISEQELAGAIEEALRRNGSEGSAFEPIVVSGPRGALPHGRGSDRRLNAGELVTLDFGAIVQGYHSDLTRTFAVGEAPPDQLAWCEAVESAIRAALDLSVAGTPCKELDAAARRTIDAAGFGDYFVHNLGHGIGLEVHEGPRISPNSSDVLTEGMVFTIEPGIYLPDSGGVRIEEDVVVTGEGPRVLSRTTRACRPADR